MVSKLVVDAAVSAVHVVVDAEVVVVVDEDEDENDPAIVRGGGTPKAVVRIGTVITMSRSNRGVTTDRIGSRSTICVDFVYRILVLAGFCW